MKIAQTPPEAMKTNTSLFQSKLFRVFFLFLLIIILDFGLGNILHLFYFRQKTGVLSRVTFAMEKVKTPGLILGSSRASHHYVSDSLSKALGVKFYNAGKDGQSIFYYYAVLQSVLARYEPRIIVLDILNDELDNKQESYDRLAELLPYYKTHPVIGPILKLRGPYEKYKMLSATYPYNSLLLTIGIGNTNFNKDRFAEINGYIPLTGQVKESVKADKKGTVENIDVNKIDIYTKFLEACKKHNVKLIIAISPSWQNQQVTQSTIIAKQLAQKYNVPFFDYSNNAAYLLKSASFYDSNHLNNSGAIRFTNDIIPQIKQQFN